MDQTFTNSTTLVIDDNEIDVLINRRLIELTRFSEHIIITHTAEEALDYLKKECTSERYVPDWIFLDVYLPGMNGYEFIEEFKNLPDFIKEKTKIIVLSVLLQDEKFQKAMQNHFVLTSIEKPLTMESLKMLKMTPYEYIHRHP